MEKRIFLASPHMSEEGYEKEYIKEAFDTNWIAPLGENVNKFEEELANYVGAKCGAALSAGTAAIHMALKALDVKEGDILVYFVSGTQLNADYCKFNNLYSNSCDTCVS